MLTGEEARDVVRANTPVRSRGEGVGIAYQKASGHGQEVHPLGLVAYVWEDGRASAQGEVRGRVVVFSEPGVFEWNTDFPSQEALTVQSSYVTYQKPGETEPSAQDHTVSGTGGQESPLCCVVHLPSKLKI